MKAATMQLKTFEVNPQLLFFVHLIELSVGTKSLMAMLKLEHLSFSLAVNYVERFSPVTFNRGLAVQ